MSVAAGISAASIESGCRPGTPVVRVMPNTPMLVGQGMSRDRRRGRAPGQEHLDRAEELMAAGRPGACGCPRPQIDAVTAVSGSGPAYLFLVVEAMIDAGVLLGLPRAARHRTRDADRARAATMLRETGEHPALLREAVTSPGGTTAAALRELENGGVRAAFYDALEACRDRAQDLARS